MRIITVVALLVIIAFAGSALAVAPGKTVEFAGGGTGTVVFSGDTHKGAKCAECHPNPFQMKKGATKITMADHVPGKMCGKCHDGTKAFGMDSANCAKCHKK